MAEQKNVIGTYLYGASITGIQNFIFQTNKLREIAGGSELIELICSGSFDQFEDQEGKRIMRAAGNIRHLFKDVDACKKAVLEFPRLVNKLAPGVAICQAVIEIKEKMSLKEALKQLESNLKIQRNKSLMTSNIGFLATKRSQRTGLPAVDYEKGEPVDITSLSKIKAGTSSRTNLCKKAFGNYKKEISLNIEEMGTDKSWIAVIHADGNSLGKIIQEIAENDNAENLLAEFSSLLEEATINSAREAYIEAEKMFREETSIPIRPIVLGGDDLTVVCRADIAIKYTEKFLGQFENNTKKLLGKFSTNIKDNLLIENGLKACAGIAYIKKSFPFHYGYSLANELCSEAKKESERKHSCIMFHKVQDSFVTDYNSIIQKELSVGNNPIFKFGPYFINDVPNNKWTINNLRKFCNELIDISRKEDNNSSGVKSGLRNLIENLQHDSEISKQKMERLISNIDTKNDYLVKTLKDFSNPEKSVPFYDALSLISIETKF